MAADTSSDVPTSMPRWLSAPATPAPRAAGFSIRTSFNGGASIAKFAYPGRRFAGSAPKSLR
ncbi:hypothetical protein FrEUN1fDRAFT_1981 [Parafrankia sp. EUN1f]|nr:hypothetical protein FrEUN1fDRAFT_1981 [Parafrankia sp. EUN1f]